MLVGLVGPQDPPRDDVASAIESCRTAGIKVLMVTGDHPVAARSIARQVGLLGPNDLVLLDDHFATIVERGRASSADIRRFLTCHLTDDVVVRTPFVVWALTVLQVLALDIGTDLLPALALGAEPPDPKTMQGKAPTGSPIDRTVLVRVFGILGPTEAVVEMGAFLGVLLAGGWVLGRTPEAELPAVASGTAFAAVVLGRLANALACRSGSRTVVRVAPRGNRPLGWAVVVELVLLLAFLDVPPVADLLGGVLPSAPGWALAACAVPAVLVVDSLHKEVRSRRRAARSPVA